jgi:hypothetical protein
MLEDRSVLRLDRLSALDAAFVDLDRPAARRRSPVRVRPSAPAALAIDRTRGAVRGSRAFARAIRRPDVAALGDVRVAVEQLARPATATALDRSAGPERAVAFASLPLEQRPRPDGGAEGGLRCDALDLVARAAAGAASFNAVVSNIPGPPVTPLLLGRHLVAVRPCARLLEGHGLATV